MCLGIPGRLVEIDTSDVVRMGKVSFGGVTKRVCLEHVRDAVVGDYVLVHVGFALQRIDAEEAQRVFDLLRELGELADLEADDAADDGVEVDLS
jgi:hydrogenase expression/formation protein HypC